MAGLGSLTFDQLKLLPTTSLGSLSNLSAAEKGKLNNQLASAQSRLAKLTGTGSISVPNAGRATIMGFASMDKVHETAAQMSIPLKSMTDVMSKATQAGFNPISNLTELGGSQEDLDSMLATIQGSVGSMLNDPTILGSRSAEVFGLESSIATMVTEVQQLEDLLTEIENVMSARANGTLLEPDVYTDHLTGDPALDRLSQTYKDFVQENIVIPFEENFERFQDLLLGLQAEDPDLPTPLFDLVYGPPVSVKGQFVLSEDGLYYDSREGGLDVSAVLPHVSGVVDASTAWGLNFAPNLGGKGKIYDQKDLDALKNSVLDFDYTVDSDFVNKYYDTDDVLQTFDKDKAHHVGIVSGQITDLVVSGYSSDSALVINYYNSIAAIASSYDEKIKKRKKQLQLIAIFASDKYNFTTETIGDPKNLGLGLDILIEGANVGKDTEFWIPVERIPINDFTFLKGTGFEASLDDQKDLVLFSEDLEDIILPYQPKFLVSPAQSLSVLDKFSITPITPVDFPHIDGTTNVSGSGSFVKSISDSLITSGLILGYNFLQPNVEAASSLEYSLDNFAPDSGGKLNGQLISSSVDYAFPSGLSIPYLTGTYFNVNKETGREGGTYVVLPNNQRPDGTPTDVATQEVANATYTLSSNPDTGKGGGFSFDFWVYVPSLTMTDAHRYRLVFANENSGKGTGGNFLHNKRLKEDGTTRDDVTHGMIAGFRDKGGATTPSGLEFCVLPTISQGRGSSGGHSVCIAGDFSGMPDVVPDTSAVTELGITIPYTTSAEGVTISDASSNFVHMAISFDYELNIVKTFLDGNLLQSNTLSTAFNLGLNESLKIPTLTTTPSNSSDIFESSWQDETGNNGPRAGNLGEAFTPWVLGGGFTDGVLKELTAHADPGFLGYNTNDIHGTEGQHLPANITSSSNPTRSGLDGFLGSFKMYAKALSTTEVLTNFNAQKGYFKNIKLS